MPQLASALHLALLASEIVLDHASTEEHAVLLLMQSAAG